MLNNRYIIIYNKKTCRKFVITLLYVLFFYESEIIEDSNAI